MALLTTVSARNRCHVHVPSAGDAEHVITERVSPSDDHDLVHALIFFGPILRRHIPHTGTPLVRRRVMDSRGAEGLVPGIDDEWLRYPAVLVPVGDHRRAGWIVQVKALNVLFHLHSRFVAATLDPNLEIMESELCCLLAGLRVCAVVVAPLLVPEEGIWSSPQIGQHMIKYFRIQVD